jgi:undecaprenyl-diphosphatase
MDYFLFQKINPVKSFFSFLISLDINIFNRVNSLAGQWNWLDVVGIFLAKYLVYLLVVLTIFILWKKWKVIFQAFLAAILAKFGIVDFIRWFWPQARPFVENNVNLLIDKVNHSAFPSGHAAFTFAISTVIFLYAKKVYPVSSRRLWYGAGIGFFIASFLISISRVFVGVHWPSDILAGALIGIFSGWLIVKIFKR